MAIECNKQSADAGIPLSSSGEMADATLRPEYSVLQLEKQGRQQAAPEGAARGTAAPLEQGYAPAMAPARACQESFSLDL